MNLYSKGVLVLKISIFSGSGYLGLFLLYSCLLVIVIGMLCSRPSKNCYPPYDIALKLGLQSFQTTIFHRQAVSFRECILPSVVTLSSQNGLFFAQFLECSVGKRTLEKNTNASEGWNSTVSSVFVTSKHHPVLQFPSIPESPKYLLSRCFGPHKGLVRRCLWSKHPLRRYLEDQGYS